MKIRKRDFDIFNLSFLDIISCGFGAVVLLVLISNNAENASESDVVQVKELFGQVTSLENRIDNLAQEIIVKRRKMTTSWQKAGN